MGVKLSLKYLRSTKGYAVFEYCSSGERKTGVVYVPRRNMNEIEAFDHLIFQPDKQKKASK